VASVAVNTGPISAQDRPQDVPVEKWPMLIGARRTFAKANIPYDCRELLRFVSEAREFDMIGKLGYRDEEDFIRQGLGMDPETVGYALAALKRIKPDWALPFKEAVKFGKQGGDRKSEKAKEDQGNNVTLKRRGNRSDYTLARLRRDRPDLAEQVTAGTLSAHAAAIQAGFRYATWSAPVDVDALRVAIRKRYPGFCNGCNSNKGDR
jgi:hypothetical protein